MPDVGVLQLKISADAGNATRSLTKLQTRLSEISNLAQNNFNLENVSTQIQNIVNTVKGDKGVSTAVRNLGTLLNAISSFSKVKNFGLDESQLNSLRELQAVANGFKMGATGVQLNQMRQAISEPWNAANAQSASAAMESIATGAERLASSGAQAKISGIASALKEYSSAINELKASLGDGVSIPTEVTAGQGKGFVALGLASSQGMTEGISEGTGDVASAAQELANAAKEATKNELEIHSPSRVYHEIGIQTAAGFENGLREGLSNIDVYSPLEALKSRFMTAGNEVAKQVSGSISSLREYKEAVLSVGQRLDPAAFNIPVATNSIEEAKDSLDGFAESSQVIKEVETVVHGIGTAEAHVAENMEAVNRATAEDIQLRKEALALENQRRLESNYANYRELYLSKEEDWEKQVPEMYGFTPKALQEGETYADAMRITMEEVNQYIDEFIEKTNTPTGTLLRDTIDETLGVGRAVKSAEESAQVLQTIPDIQEKTQEVQSSINGMSNSMSKGQTATRVLGENLKDLDNELKEKKTDLNNASDETKSLTSRFLELMIGCEGLKGSISRMFPTLSGLYNRFKQLVKYRALRAIIKQISEGFQEGTENYYYYSKAIGGDFASSMDTAASSLLQMKNSIGAAVSPLISSLIPYLQQVVNLFINVVNYANQFFALLNGQSTWSRATAATTTAFDDISDSASGASNSINDLLADWDELNIIQSENSGTGSTSSKVTLDDYATMFEEVSDFDESIKEIVSFIKENFDEILTVVTAIGAAILGWKVSNAFSGLIGNLGLLVGEIASIYIGIKLTDLFGKQYAESGEPGWLIADALSGAVGAYLAGRIASRLIGSSAGGYFVAGFTLILEGAVNIKNAISAMEQQHEGEAWVLDALGSIEVGIGSGLAALGLGASGPVSLAVGAVVTVGVFLLSIPIMMSVKRAAEYKQMAIDAFSETGANGISTEEYITALQARVDELTKGSEVVVSIALPVVEHKENFLANLLTLKSLNALISSEGLSEEDATAFKNAWDIVISELAEIEKINFQTIYAGLDDVIANGSEKIKQEAVALRKEAIELAKIMGGARGAMEEEMNQLTSDIANGNLSGDDYDKAIERYSELYKIISSSDDSGIGDLQKRLSEGAAFDFNTGESSVEEAVNFIKTLSEQEISPALETAKEAYEEEIKAVEDAYSELEMLHKANYLTDEQYEQSKEGLDKIKQLYDDAYADRVEQINALTNDAYAKVLEQAIDGLSNIDTNDKEAVNAYVKNVLDPIFKALEEAGYTIPEEVKSLLGMITEEVYSFDVTTVPASERESIYQAFEQYAETEGINEMRYPVKMSIAFEIDKNNGQPVDINSDDAKDIVNSLLKTFDYQMDNVFEMLNESFGWSYDEILSKIDFGELDIEQLEDLIETVAYLKELAQEKLIPTSEDYNVEYSSIEEEYDAIIEQIQQIIKDRTAEEIEAPKLKVNQEAEVTYDAYLGGESENWWKTSFANVWDSAMAKINSVFNVNGTENTGFGNITISTERNDEQDTINIEEGTKRGNAGMETKQNQTNNYLAQAISYLSIIANNSGNGLSNAGISTVGGLVSNAINAFNLVKG